MSGNQAEERREILKILQQAEDLYVVASDSTRMPYVECDEETYDDEILIFDSQEKAARICEILADKGFAIHMVKIPQKQRLAFFANLFVTGVNAVLLNRGSGDPKRIPLERVISRPEVPRFSAEIGEALRKGERPQFRLENPEFHLTALYLMQMARGSKASLYQKETGELQEEMMTHYHEGFFLSARTEDGHTPLLHNKEGECLQPLFTDMQEFLKFQHAHRDDGKTLKTFVVSEQEFVKHLAKETTAIVINPFGVSLVLKVNRKNPA